MNLKNLLSIVVLFCVLAATGCQQQTPTTPTAAESLEITLGLEADTAERAKALKAKGPYEIESFETFSDSKGGFLYLVNPGSGRPGNVSGYSVAEENMYWEEYKKTPRGFRVSFKWREPTVGEAKTDVFSYLEPVFTPGKPSWDKPRPKP